MGKAKGERERKRKRRPERGPASSLSCCLLEKIGWRDVESGFKNTAPHHILLEAPSIRRSIQIDCLEGLIVLFLLLMRLKQEVSELQTPSLIWGNDSGVWETVAGSSPCSSGDSVQLQSNCWREGDKWTILFVSVCVCVNKNKMAFPEQTWLVSTGWKIQVCSFLLFGFRQRT